MNHHLPLTYYQYLTAKRHPFTKPALQKCNHSIPQDTYQTIRGIDFEKSNFSYPRWASGRKRIITDAIKVIPANEFISPPLHWLAWMFGSNKRMIVPVKKKMVPTARHPQRKKFFFCMRMSWERLLFSLIMMMSILISQANEMQNWAKRQTCPLLNQSQRYVHQMYRQLPSTVRKHSGMLQRGTGSIASSVISATIKAAAAAFSISLYSGKITSSSKNGTVVSMAMAKVRAARHEARLYTKVVFSFDYFDGTMMNYFYKW